MVARAVWQMVWCWLFGPELSTMSSFPSLRLLYFDFPGAAECIRLALHYAEIPHEDYRFADRSELHALKDAGTLPFGQGL